LSSILLFVLMFLMIGVRFFGVVDHGIGAVCLAH